MLLLSRGECQTLRQKVRAARRWPRHSAVAWLAAGCGLRGWSSLTQLAAARARRRGARAPRGSIHPAQTTAAPAGAALTHTTTRPPHHYARTPRASSFACLDFLSLLQSHLLVNAGSNFEITNTRASQKLFKQLMNMCTYILVHVCMSIYMFCTFYKSLFVRKTAYIFFIYMRIHIQKFLNNLYSFGLESVQLQTHLPSYLFHLSVQLVDYML